MINSCTLNEDEIKEAIASWLNRAKDSSGRAAARPYDAKHVSLSASNPDRMGDRVTFSAHATETLRPAPKRDVGDEALADDDPSPPVTVAPKAKASDLAPVLNVGRLRERSALTEGDRHVVLVAHGSDPSLGRFLQDLTVIEAYPDTTDAKGSWNSTFKIKVERR